LLTKIASLEKLCTDVDDLKTNNADLNVTIKRMGQEINTLNDQLQSPSPDEDLSKQLTSVQAELAELQSTHSKNLTHQEGMKSTMTWLENQIEKYKQEAAEACEEIESLKMSLHELERSEIGNESADGNVQALREELEAMQAKQSGLEHEIQLKNEQELNSFEQIKTLKIDLEKLSTTSTNCDNLEQINLSNEQTILELENKIKAIEAEFGVKIQQANSEREELEKSTQVEVNVLEGKIEECNIQAEQLQQTINGLEATIATLCARDNELLEVRSQNKDYSNVIGQLEVEKQMLAEAMTKEVQQYDEQISR
jgi:chromosome segregation ATPase